MMSTAGRGTDIDVPMPTDRLVHDWRTAMERAEAYALAVGEPAEVARRVAIEAVRDAATAPVWAANGDACSEALAAVRRHLMTTPPESRDDAPAWLDWRLRRWLHLGGDRSATLPAADVVLPPLMRASMGAGPPTPVPDDPALGRWRPVARRRRWLLGALVLGPTVAASIVMANALPEHGGSALETIIVVFFGLLFAWISLGFWTAMAGAVLQVRGDRFAITHTSGVTSAPIDPEGRTAIVMPICEEPVDRVFAGLRATWESLEAAGVLAGFDFFVLSDTAEPAAAMREEMAWATWCRDVGGFGRVFYRRRRVRIARKSGNIADFCRRWGKRYRYMVVLDADSVMSGRTLARLVQLMEARPDAAVIQTAPVAVNRRSTFARLQQFAGRVYGPLFAAGLHYWQLGDGQYWGHNAIIRVAPFMTECVLPRLPGPPPLGGRILSHDFVEAALLGRAGWTLWLAYDLDGTWEEAPPRLLDEMQRDRRWCQGNLQHLRLLFAQRWRGAHRALFLNGAMSYASALLWLCFLVLGTVESVRRVLTPPDYFPEAHALFPTWPVWEPMRVLSIVALTATILVLPKAVGVFLTIWRREAQSFGGAGRLTGSALGELLASSLLAPVRMAFHSRFVLVTLLGRSIEWVTPPRDDRGTPWSEALKRHGPHAVPAVIWAIAVRILDPVYFWWLLPVAGALVVAIPVSVLLSRSDVGDWLRARRWLLIPEETTPPVEIARMRALVAAAPATPADAAVRTIVDPLANAIHRALLGAPRQVATIIRSERDALLERAIGEGPSSLSVRDWRTVLRDPMLVDRAHLAVWALPPAAAARWGVGYPPRTTSSGSGTAAS